jgi:ketosteroid isomerase-like protein
MTVKLIRHCVFLSCVAAASFCPAQTPASSAAQQLEPLLHEQMLAANAHDTDRFMATYSRDPGLMFLINGEIYRGWDKLHEQQLKWWQNGRAQSTYTEVIPPEITSLGAKTLLVTQQLASHRTRPDGTPSDGQFALTTIWQLEPAGWRVIYGHESWTTKP